MSYLGDFTAGDTVYLYFTTHAADGGVAAPSGGFDDADVVVYEDGSATQLTTGITVTSPFDSVTGLHQVAIDTSAAGYAAGSDYAVFLNPDTETVDGQDVISILGYFSLQNRYDGTTSVMTTQMTESYAANGVAPTPAEALFAIHQMLMQFGIAGTALTVRQLDDSTTAFTVTLDSATAPTDAKRV